MTEVPEAKPTKPEQANGADEKTDILTTELKAIVAEKSQEGAVGTLELDKESGEVTPEEDVIISLKQAGIDVGDEASLRSLLGSTEIVETQAGRHQLKTLLNSDGFDAATLERIDQLGIKAKLAEVITQRMRDVVHRMVPDEALVNTNAQVLPELSDVELDDPIGEVRKIIDDPKLQATQGTMQNVVLSEMSPYVLKLLKTDLRDKEYAIATLKHFTAAKEVFGTDFLPEQQAVELKNPPILCILQEKLDLNQYTIFSESHGLDQLISAVHDSPENLKCVADFVEGAHRLLEEKRLCLDLLGDNVVFQVDADGLLEIKIIDTGCFDADYSDPRNQESIQRVQGVLSRLATSIH